MPLDGCTAGASPKPTSQQGVRRQGALDLNPASKSNEHARRPPTLVRIVGEGQHAQHAGMPELTECELGQSTSGEERSGQGEQGSHRASPVDPGMAQCRSKWIDVGRLSGNPLGRNGAFK